MNKSFTSLIRKYNSSFISVNDMTLVNDDITMSSKPNNYHQETNNRLMSINEQRKQKLNQLISLLSRGYLNHTIAKVIG